MNVGLVGLNFRSAPLELRERAACPAAAVPAVLKRVCDAVSGGNYVLLSTCNRTELYVSGIDLAKERDRLIGALLCGGLGTGADPVPHFYVKEDQEAVEHLFSVACSLDSLVIGETEVLGQVKQAYLLASQEGCVGARLHGLFQHAMRAAKRVHTETDICKGKVSVSSVAVDFAEHIFDDLRTKTVMVIGAGEMAELTVQTLVERGVREVFVLNRSLDRGQQLAARYGGKAILLDMIDDYLHRADIVISSTGAPGYVVRTPSVQQASVQRRGRPILLIDIAVPRDIEPAAGDLDNVYLYHIDDLQRVAVENLARRQDDIDRARRIVRAEASECAASSDKPPLAEIMRELDQFALGIRMDAIEKTLARERMSDLSEAQREEVRLMAERITGRLLGGAREALHRASRNGHWDHYATVVRDLFRLRPPSAPSDGPGSEAAISNKEKQT